MVSSVALISTLWVFPIPSLAQPAVIAKVAGIGCFGFGLGSILHFITKYGPGRLDPINFWKD
jgi:hypothetical protein